MVTKKKNKKSKKNNTSIETTELSFFYRDSKKRVVLKIIDDQVMVARFKDMDKITKKNIILICKKLSNFDIKQLKKFLDFKIQEDEFCS